MKKKCLFALKILAVLCGGFVSVFLVYFFNLDMKLLSKIEPLFLKHYDNMERKTYV